MLAAVSIRQGHNTRRTASTVFTKNPHSIGESTRFFDFPKGKSMLLKTIKRAKRAFLLTFAAQGKSKGPVSTIHPHKGSCGPSHGARGGTSRVVLMHLVQPRA